MGYCRLYVGFRRVRQGGKERVRLLVLDLHQHQPRHIPATVACRIVENEPLCFVDAFGTERVVAGEPAEFIEHVVGIYVC